MNTNRPLFVSILLLVASAIIASAAPTSDPTPTEIDAIFEDYDSTSSPGCSLGVIRDGEFIYKRSYGMANLEHGIALSSGSVFRTASVGKQFTAMAIAILDQQGVISLDDSLRLHFPEFPAWADDITIRNLVHHTSGIRDYLTLAWLAGMGDESHYTDQYALDLLARQKHLNFRPGDDYLYSNSGYLLLAHIVDRATGQSLRDWAANNLFGPLGMKSSHFHDDHTHVVPSRADGYAPADEGFRLSMTTLDMVGDGGVYTTIEDFLYWDRNFYDNRLGSGGAGLIELVTTPGELNGDKPITYAFGLDIDTYRGLPIVAHGGGFVGFRTDTIRFPEQRFSVVVYCNRADADPGERSRRVADLYLADRLEPQRGSAESDEADGSAVELSERHLNDLAGHYWDEERRTAWEVSLEEGGLFLALSDEDRFALVPAAEDRFDVRGPWFNAEVRFEKVAESDHQMAFLVEGAEEPRIFRSFAPREVTDEVLRSYVGTYRSEELGIDYDLEVADGVLRFRIVRHEAHALEPLFDEIFANPDYGTFEFHHSSDGSIGGFKLDAGRVRNLEFVRR